MIAFSYYGAKNQLLPQLLPLLPSANHYCEPFAGSAAVLLNRSMSPIETINDLNGDIVNFFRVLRDHGPELFRLLELTPYALAEFEGAWIHSNCEIEQARRFFVRVQIDMAKGGKRSDKSWSVNRKYNEGGHSYAPNNFHKKVTQIMNIVKRLKNVQIENRHYSDCIKKYDSSQTLFYLDPPYVHTSRNSSNDYQYEMDDNEHIKLAELLQKVKGRVAISGYNSPLYESLYNGWNKVQFKSRRPPMSRGSGLVREECLWTNYPISIQLTIV